LKESMMKRLAMILTLGGLTVFALGCGGTEPDPETMAATSHLRVAPAWMAEADLPGCDQLEVEARGNLQLLRHPLDPVLVIPTCGGEPLCADTLQGAHDAIPAVQGTGLGSGAELIGLSQGDDPIPIIDQQSEQETEEETVEEEEENVPDHSEHDHKGDQTATGNVIDADSLRRDDPIPIHITRNKLMSVGR
jgi:hypothetical protein